MGCRKSLYCSASTESKGDLDRMHNLNYNKKKQETTDLNTLLLLELGFFNDLKNKKMRFNPRPFSHPTPLKPKKPELKKEKMVDLNLEITKKIDELLENKEKKSEETQPLTHTSIEPSMLNHIEVRQQILKVPQMSMTKTEMQPINAFGEMGAREEFIEIDSSTETPVSIQQEKEMHSWMSDDQVKDTQKTLWGFAKLKIKKAKGKTPTKTNAKPAKTKINNDVIKTKLELEKTKQEIEKRQRDLQAAKELEKQKMQELKQKEIESKKQEKIKEIEKKKRLKLQKIRERELKKEERLRQKELLKKQKLKEALDKKSLLEKNKKEKQKELELKAKEAEKRKQEKQKEIQLKKKHEEKEKLKKLKTEKPKKKEKFSLFKKDKKKEKKVTPPGEIIPKIDTKAIPKDEHVPWDDDVEKLIPILDSLLEKLPEEVIENFANSDDFGLYEKVVSKYKK